jgi:hypothetical protein
LSHITTTIHIHPPTKQTNKQTTTAKTTMGFSTSQQLALAITPKVTGVMSFACSSLICLSVLLDQKKLATMYHRLILGASVVDLNNSFWFFMSTWPIPKTSTAMFAVGSPWTCNMQGWFIQVGISMAFYNTSLALYYTLVLRYGWSEERAVKLEPFMHFLPLLWGIATATISIPLRLFNNANLWCWIAPYPAGCVGDACIRGANADYYRWGFYYGPLWLNIITITILMIVVFVHVRKASSQDVDLDDDDDDNKDEKENNKSALLKSSDSNKKNNKKTSSTSRKNVNRYVLIQCFLYSGAFYLNWICLTVSSTLKPVPRILTRSRYSHTYIHLSFFSCARKPR